MKRTVELVNDWAAFETKNPGASIEDFCRYRLNTAKNTEVNKKLFKGLLPPTQNTTLGKLLIRIAKLMSNYSELALKNVNVKQLDDFVFLTTIAHLKDPKKTELIYYTITELSTGLLVLDRLKKQGYIIEREDLVDKRSKRVAITPKGEKVLIECYKYMQRVSEMLFFEMEPQEINLCIQLLQDMDIKFSSLFHKHKSDSFTEIYRKITGKKFQKPKIDRKFI
jgi:DNA-binding MarR family transcriptional regulator